LELESLIYILAGSTFGLILRMFIKSIYERGKLFSLNNILIINILSSLFLGAFISLNITNKNLLLFFFIGFLGCFSTFSSFIYQLFSLIQKRKYLISVLYYVEVLVLSFLFFCSGYFIILVLKN